MKGRHGAKFEAFTRSDAFLERTRSFLLRHEVEARVILEGAERATTEDGWRFFSVADESGPVLAAMLNPPYTLVVSPGRDEAIPALHDGIQAMGLSLPGVSGAGPIARRFAALWTARTGERVMDGLKLTIHQLTKVVWPSPPPHGRLREATEEDLPIVNEWMNRLTKEFGNRPGADLSEFAGEHFAQGQLFVWDQDGPVSTASWQGETLNGVAIEGVYTPPEHRGHGYASAVVAALSQRMLDSGRRFCYLFTDRTAAGPERIYRRIGYQPIAEVDNYLFRPNDSRG